MTEPDARAAQEEASGAPKPPVTGHADIDAALAALELGPDVGTHPGSIAAALDVVQAALHSSSGHPPAR